MTPKVFCAAAFIIKAIGLDNLLWAEAEKLPKYEKSVVVDIDPRFLEEARGFVNYRMPGFAAIISGGKLIMLRTDK